MGEEHLVVDGGQTVVHVHVNPVTELPEPTPELARVASSVERVLVRNNLQGKRPDNPVAALCVVQCMTSAEKGG